MRFKLILYPNGTAVESGFTRLIDAEGYDRLNYYSGRGYFCPLCCRVWAKWEVEAISFDALPPPYHAYSRTCPNHDKGAWASDTPGSLLLYHTDLAVLPRPLLERELLLSMSLQHKEEQNEL